MLATEIGTAILQRVIRPEIGDLSPEAARVLASLGFSESDHDRMAELSEKAQEGSLTPSEQDELDGYINISNLLAFIQSKARMALKNTDPSTSVA